MCTRAIDSIAMSNSQSVIEAGLENLHKDSFDDTSPSPSVSADTPQAQLEAYVDDLFATYADPLEAIGLDRDVVNCYASGFKRTRGQAQYNRAEPNGDRVSGTHVLRVAEGCIEDGKDWEETTRHELAHIAQYVDDGHSDGHGSSWKQWARRLDATPKACGGDAPTTDYTYLVTCLECGNQNGRHKKSKVVKQTGKYRCGKCEGKLASHLADEPVPDTAGSHVD